MCSNAQAVALSGVDGPRYHSIYSGFKFQVLSEPDSCT